MNSVGELGVTNLSILTNPFVALVFAFLSVCGCSKSSVTGPNDTSTSVRVEPDRSIRATRPDAEKTVRWLTTDLPPVVEDISGSPIKLSEPHFQANEFGQETFTMKYERPAIVRTMASNVRLVLLPATGGRLDVYINQGLLVQPQSGGTLSGITQNLLDHRGRLRSGVRAYVEMQAATMNRSAQKAERVSDVIWVGSDDQLSEVIKKGPPPNVPANEDVSTPILQPVPAGRVAKGTPLWMRCGDHWCRGNVLEVAEGDQLKLLIYLVRRDKPYLPWVANISRPELRIEQDALNEYQRDPDSFNDLAEASDAKLSRHGVPNKLEKVKLSNLQIGTAVLDFWNGMLDPCRTTGPVTDAAVPIQRVGLDNAQMVKPVKNLFVDPFGIQADHKK